MLAYTGNRRRRSKIHFAFHCHASSEKKRAVLRVEPAIFDLTDAAEAAS